MSNKPRVFIDADVLFAASASPTQYGASHVILRMAEITLLDALTNEQVMTEVERNLRVKLPKALPAFQLIVQRTLAVVPNPTRETIDQFVGLADPKDLPILVSAYENDCKHLVTFNARHFRPGIDGVEILRPGDFLRRVRSLLTQA